MVAAFGHANTNARAARMIFDELLAADQSHVCGFRREV
jgi:hypothetical protein